MAKRPARQRRRPGGVQPDLSEAQPWAEALAGGADPAEVEREVLDLGPRAGGAVRALGSAVGERSIPLLARLAWSGVGEVKLAAVEALGEVPAGAGAEALEEIARSKAEKDLRSSARRALHRLTAAGLHTPARPGPGRRGVGTATLYRAIASAYDGMGTRVLWLAAERPLGGIYMVVLEVNDVGGLVDFDARDTTRKRFAEQEAEMRARDPMAWVELPLDYARQLVEEALDLARGAGHGVPPHYAVWAPVVEGPAASFSEALVYQEISAFEARMHPTLLAQAPLLFEQPEVEPWFFLPERVEKWARQVAEPPSARLVITPESEEGRHERLLREAIADLLPPPALRGLRRRLEETAYIFLRTDRQEDARRAVAAAVTIEEERPLRRSHTFLRVLIERSIEIALQVKRTGPEPPRLVRLP